MPKGFCTVNEAAERLNITPARVRQLLNQGRVRDAEKVGPNWLIPTDDDGRPKLDLQPPGRPKGAGRRELDEFSKKKEAAKRWRGEKR